MKSNTNVGQIDRTLRLIIATVLMLTVVMGYFTGTPAFLILIGSFVLAATGVVRFCPLYLPFGIKTFRANSQ